MLMSCVGENRDGGELTCLTVVKERYCYKKRNCEGDATLMMMMMMMMMVICVRSFD